MVTISTKQNDEMLGFIGSIRPAVAKVIVDGHENPQIWSATIVDLAIRGFVKITEDVQISRKELLGRIFNALYGVAFILFSLYWVYNGELLVKILSSFFAIIFLHNTFFSCLRIFVQKEYTMKRIDSSLSLSLEPYEVKFLDSIFCGVNVCSTRGLKSSTFTQGIILSRELQKAAKSFSKRNISASDRVVFRDKVFELKKYLENIVQNFDQKNTIDIPQEFLPYLILFNIGNKKLDQSGVYNRRAFLWYSNGFGFPVSEDGFLLTEFSRSFTVCLRGSKGKWFSRSAGIGMVMKNWEKQ